MTKTDGHKWSNDRYFHSRHCTLCDIGYFEWARKRFTLVCEGVKP